MQSRCSRQDLLYAVPGMIGNPVSIPLSAAGRLSYHARLRDKQRIPDQFSAHPENALDSTYKPLAERALTGQ
jgi:hypothetical protein